MDFPGEARGILNHYITYSRNSCVAQSLECGSDWGQLVIASDRRERSNLTRG